MSAEERADDALELARARHRERRDALESERAAVRGREKRLVLAAFFLIVSFAIGSLAAFDGFLPFSGWATAGLGLVLVVLAISLREGVTARRRELEQRLAFHDRALARLDDRFEAQGDGGLGYADGAHPFAQDLDLFGPQSLFARLDDTASVLARDALAARLKALHPAPGVEAAQTVTRELTADLAFRESYDARLRMLLAGQPGDERWRERCEKQTRELPEWGRSETPPADGPLAFVLEVALGLFALGCVAAWALGELPVSLLAVPLLINLAVVARKKDLGELVERFETVGATLGGWRRVFEVLEQARHEAPVLRALREPLLGEHPASLLCAQLEGRVARLSWRRNAVFAFTIGLLTLWDLHARRALLAWKRRHGRQLAEWLEGAAGYEVFCSLAAYADSQPDAAWPVVAEDGPPLEAERLAHPLLPRSARVANDLSIPSEGSVLLVTGSNMSGKSTFLRTVGLAAVMARLGLPVPARSLRMRPMLPVSCMRVQDSLASGSSLFHAEVTRLKVCTDLCEREPRALVLLDEILSGTNSRERHLGAEAVLATLSARPTLILCSTHDLGLGAIKERLGERCRIVHFKDSVADGRMSFDYLLREGPVPSTNALRVMRLVGLDVPVPPDEAS